MDNKRAKRRGPRFRKNKADGGRIPSSFGGDEAGFKKLERDQMRAARDRLRTLIVEQGGVRAASRRLRLRHGTVSKWLAPHKPSSPTMESLWRVAQLTGASLDWLLGFPVPRAIGTRSEVGGAAEAVVQIIGREIRLRTGFSQEFIVAALGSPNDFMQGVLNQSLGTVASLAARKRRLALFAKPAKRLRSPSSIGEALGDYLRELGDTELDKEREALRYLPDPD